jgi:hypothetical protein
MTHGPILTLGPIIAGLRDPNDSELPDTSYQEYSIRFSFFKHQEPN